MDGYWWNTSERVCHRKEECQLSFWVRGVWSSWKSTGMRSQRTTALPLMSCATSCLAPVSIRFWVYGVLLWKRLCFVRLWRIQNKSGIAPSLMSWQREEGRVPKTSTQLTLLQVEQGWDACSIWVEVKGYRMPTMTGGSWWVSSSMRICSFHFSLPEARVYLHCFLILLRGD